MITPSDFKKMKKRTGFASMETEKQRAIASMGGKAIPPEKRSFSQDRELASRAGRKGGQNVAPENRSFSRNTDLASAAGRKGGAASNGGKSRPDVASVASSTPKGTTKIKPVSVAPDASL
jgi:general stress protein YciG